MAVGLLVVVAAMLAPFAYVQKKVAEKARDEAVAAKSREEVAKDNALSAKFKAENAANEAAKQKEIAQKERDRADFARVQASKNAAVAVGSARESRAREVAASAA